jgi:phage regulator Rha-like protein
MERSEQKQELDLAEEVIQQRIFIIRGQRVILDSDLARLYGITTKTFNRAVKRNALRFPSNFMFQLTRQELENLRYQFGTSSFAHGGRRYLPYVFTEHGVAMLSAVLNSEKAIKMSIFIIQAFIKMRQLLLHGKDVDLRLLQLETTQEKQGEMIEDVLKIVRKLIDKPIKPPGPIGFTT